MKWEQKYVLVILVSMMVVVLGMNVVFAHGFGIQKKSMAWGDKTWQTPFNPSATTWKSPTIEKFTLIQERHSFMVKMNEVVKEAKETGDWSEIKALKEEFIINEGKFGYSHFGKKGSCACPLFAK